MWWAVTWFYCYYWNIDTTLCLAMNTSFKYLNQFSLFSVLWNDTAWSTDHFLHNRDRKPLFFYKTYIKTLFFLSSLSTPTVQRLCVQHPAKKSSFSNALSSLFAYQCTFNRIQFWMWLAALHLRLDVCTFEGDKHQVDGNAPFFREHFSPCQLHLRFRRCWHNSLSV